MAQGYTPTGEVTKPTGAQLRQSLGYVPARAPQVGSSKLSLGGSPTQPILDAVTSAILDDIGSTRGDILYRGAAGWAALAPGAAGTLLTAHGAGADPTWAAGGGGGITQLTGDVTAGPGSGSVAATLAASGVAAGTYGDATHVAQVTIDAKGRVTTAANVAISGGGGGGSLGYIGGPPAQFDPRSSNASGTGFFVGRVIVVPKATTINSLIIPVTANVPACVVTPAIYGVTAGTWDIAALLKSGPAVTGIVKGAQVLPLSAGLVVAQGDILWVGVTISGAAISFAQCSATGSVFFASPAIPPNPAAAPTYNGTTAAVWASE